MTHTAAHRACTAGGVRSNTTRQQGQHRKIISKGQQRIQSSRRRARTPLTVLLLRLPQMQPQPPAAAAHPAGPLSRQTGKNYGATARQKTKKARAAVRKQRTTNHCSFIRVWRFMLGKVRARRRQHRGSFAACSICTLPITLRRRRPRGSYRI